MPRKKYGTLTVLPGTRTDEHDDLFTRIYKEYKPTMRKYLARHFVTDEAVQDDILQDVFLAVWEVLPALDLEHRSSSGEQGD